MGAAPDVVGQSLDLDGTDYRVIGVMPEGFRFPKKQIQLWRPAAASTWWKQYAGVRDRLAVVVFGRLRPDRTFQEAQVEMNTIARRLELQYPENNRGYGARVEPLHSHALGNPRFFWINPPIAVRRPGIDGRHSFFEPCPMTLANLQRPANLTGFD